MAVRLFPFIGLAMLGASPVIAGAPASPVHFSRDVLPILTAHCLKCHGADKRKADLDLRTPALILRGSSEGPVVVKGAPDKSRLVEQISKGAMPPGKLKLTAAQVAVIRSWIDGGAQADRPEQALADVLVTDKDRQFWSFRPPVRADLPVGNHLERLRTPIDAFVLAKLESKGLSFSPDAERLALLRRAYFDMIGLPPTPDEVQRYLADNRADAYEHLVDQLLASPHYGERWGRHWLDAAGYADTQGADNDQMFIIHNEGIWRYRDYVIGAFNDDKPFDRFLTEQLAGDELHDWLAAAQLTPAMREALTATGFLRTIIDDTYAPELNRPFERQEILSKVLETVSSNVLGLTLGCAKCHNHKFDPLPQRDYYRLQACFTPAYNPEHWKSPRDRFLPASSLAQQQEIARHNAPLDRQIEQLTRQLADVRKPYERRLFDRKLAALPEVLRADLQAALAAEVGKRTAVQRYLVEKLGPSVKVEAEEITAALSAADQSVTVKIGGELAACKNKRRELEKMQALWDDGPRPTTYLLRRGNVETPGEQVEAGFPTVLCAPGYADAHRPAETPKNSSGHRLALARWLTNTRHPLTARVMVNRVWQQHFGKGIVATPDNFGRLGVPPTHPELLDWLAVDFADNGWKIKRLHKLIMTSTVYRQASRRRSPGETSPAEALDPANDLLWRMNLRRLEAESIRDAVLAVSGKLDRTLGGPPVPLFATPDGFVRVAKDGVSALGKWRRSVYLLARRSYPATLLDVFDYPITSLNCTRRVQSATPLQALTLLNSDFIMEHADHCAGRLTGTVAEKIDGAFVLALARKPAAIEVEACAAHLRKQTQLHASRSASVQDAERKALASLCQMLICANEFLYVE